MRRKLSPWVCCKRDAAAKPACTLKHVAARELCGSLRVATGLPQSVQFCFLRAIYGMEYDEYEYNIIKNYKEFLSPRGCDYMLFTTTDLFNRFHASSSFEPMPLILFWTPYLTVWHRHAGTWGSTCQKTLWRFAQIMALRVGLGTGENLKPWPWLCANHHVNPLYLGCGTAVEVHNYSIYNNIQDPFRSWSSVGIFAFLRILWDVHHANFATQVPLFGGVKKLTSSFLQHREPLQLPFGKTNTDPRQGLED